MVAYAGLTLFALVFYRNLLVRPYAWMSAEVLETFLGASRLLGEWLRGQRPWGHDPYYYASPTALPFLCTWYPPHLIQAYLGSFLSLNGASKLLTITMALHPWLGSITLYTLLMKWTALSPWLAGLAALSLSYSVSGLKPTPSRLYTSPWMLGFLLCGMTRCWWGAGISLGMAILAGYWPLVVMLGGIGCLVWCTPWHWLA